MKYTEKVYKEMYMAMFHEVTEIIHRLQEIQQQCEELYINVEEKYNTKHLEMLECTTKENLNLYCKNKQKPL